MTLDREKGDGGSAECPNCGKTLALEPQADGSVAAAACSKCYKDPTKKAEEHAPLTAGQGAPDPELAAVPQREVGTDTTQES